MDVVGVGTAIDKKLFGIKDLMDLLIRQNEQSEGMEVSWKFNTLDGRISFGDKGPGIPSSIKEKIFQPFFTTKKGTEGTGLELSITNDIVKAHGGQLEN